MLDDQNIQRMRSRGRSVEPARMMDDDLGPLKLLPGTWSNTPGLPGRGWNMIALPFATEPGSPLNYRLLLNQYNEELTFNLVDKGVPNRGIRDLGTSENTDQFIVALDYQQRIDQIAADDFAEGALEGAAGLTIHHEPGFFLHMTNETTDGLDIARLATIPHGNSALGLGRSEIHDGAPRVPNSRGLPIGGPPNLDHPYLAPYKHFADNPFQGLFNPVEPNALLNAANAGVDIVRTTKLEIDTAIDPGGVSNIPFIERQADAADMRATFWIQELAETDANGRPKLRLQYTQTVMLDFFDRFDGVPGRLRWPHVSINTMEKISEPPEA